MPETSFSEVQVPPTTPPMTLPKPLGNAPYPFTKSELRDRLFREAGITKADIAAATKKAFHTLSEAMEANRPTYASFEGQITDCRLDPDHSQRTKAASEMLSLVDAQPSKQEGLQPAKMVVEVRFPEWFQPKEAITVTSRPVPLSETKK